jgi:mevalonate kinase
MNTYYSNGKLLLTGEYLVLDKAKSLALPTKFGQSLSIQEIDEPKLIWESYTHNNKLWLQIEFDLPKLRIVTATFDSNEDGGKDLLAETLQKILFEAKKLNTNFLDNPQGFFVKSNLTFPRNWGLGSSSTLINNIAQSANTDAFQLQFNTFGGSAYDIACAQNNNPIIYQLIDKKPIIEPVIFNPTFKDQLYFVHLNKKQNSRESIRQYKKSGSNIEGVIEEISTLTYEAVKCSLVDDFEKIMSDHERIISSIIKQKPVQKELFSDYFGQIKSLGAWGGDFILATGNMDTPNYFNKKGYPVVIPYQKMILCKKE